jgi:hypothetical protein
MISNPLRERDQGGSGLLATRRTGPRQARSTAIVRLCRCRRRERERAAQWRSLKARPGERSARGTGGGVLGRSRMASGRLSTGFNVFSILHLVCNRRMTSGRLSTGFDVFLLNSRIRVSSCPAVMPTAVNTKIRLSICF